MSLEVFRRYWPNAGAGSDGIPGIFYSFTIADAEFFMLDNRYYRDPNEAPDRQTMFGKEQLKWLRDGLRTSNATFKVVASGGTVLAEGTKFENWQHFGSERDDFLAWMFAEGVAGVFFLAGDWHVGTVNRLYRPQDGYPLTEFISSNTSIDFLRFNTEEPGDVSPKYDRPEGSVFGGVNYGALHFSGPENERTVTFRVIDRKGLVRIEESLHANELTTRGHVDLFDIDTNSGSVHEISDGEKTEN